MYRKPLVPVELLKGNERCVLGGRQKVHFSVREETSVLRTPVSGRVVRP